MGMSETKVVGPKEQRLIAQRLSRGLCPDGPNGLLSVTSELAANWSAVANAPLPQNLADLVAKLDAKLSEVGRTV